MLFLFYTISIDMFVDYIIIMFHMELFLFPFLQISIEPKPCSRRWNAEVNASASLPWRCRDGHGGGYNSPEEEPSRN